jgi:hypothetical protein
LQRRVVIDQPHKLEQRPNGFTIPQPPQRLGDALLCLWLVFFFLEPLDERLHRMGISCAS